MHCGEAGGLPIRQLTIQSSADRNQWICTRCIRIREPLCTTLQQGSFVSGNFRLAREPSAGSSLCGCGILALQRGQRLDRLSSLFFGEAQIVEALQVEPELRAGAKEMCET